MRRLLLATGNAHKVEEIQALLGDRFEVVAQDTGAAETGELAVADDSGIEIDRLGGDPGVRSARWTTEDDWIPKVLRELESCAPTARGCRYVCAAAAVWPDGREEVVVGTVEGRIAEAPRGSGGFGYDPIVVPNEGDGRTFGEMSPDEKQALSHRTRAFEQLVALL